MLSFIDSTTFKKYLYRYFLIVALSNLIPLSYIVDIDIDKLDSPYLFSFLS